MAGEAGSLSGRCIAGTNANGWQVKRCAKLLRHLRDADEGSLQVAFDIHGEGFDRRDVEDAAALIAGRLRGKHQTINAGEKCSQSLAGSRGR